MIKWYDPRPVLHILNFIETSAAYVRQSGFSTDCYMAIKLKFDCAFILHKLNNLFIYIMWISMHVTWWKICIATLTLSNVVKLKHKHNIRA